jgi:hypothetical protein
MPKTQGFFPTPDKQNTAVGHTEQNTVKQNRQTKHRKFSKPKPNPKPKSKDIQASNGVMLQKFTAMFF